MKPAWRRWLLGSVMIHAIVAGIVLARSTTTTTTQTSRSLRLGWVPIESPRGEPLTPTGLAVAGLPEARAQRRTAERSDPLGGVHDAQNINAEDRGERGDGRSTEDGRLLTQHADHVNFSPHLMNTLAVDQEHRLETARTRATFQQARHTPNPGYDPWIGSAGGVLLLRTRASERLPARGARVTDGRASDAVSRVESQPTRFAGTGLTHQASQLAMAPARLSTQAGIDGPRSGRASSAAAPVANGRASIERGRASTTADRFDERPRDNVDAEALATTLLANSLSASVHAGAARAAGRGGVGGGGAPGSGGGGAVGGRARPYGEGSGWLSLSAPDARYVRYFQLLRQHIDRLWRDAFPREDALDLRQGTVILGFVLEADGSVRQAHIRRRSGVDAFDRNVLAALSHARLPPIPTELHRDSLQITAPFVFRNPIVR